MTLALPRPAPGDMDAGDAAGFLSRPTQLERAVLVVTLITFAWGTPLEWATFAQGSRPTSSALTQLIFLALFGCSVLALNGNWHVVRRAASREPILPAIIAIATISTLWSSQPAGTLQEGLVLAVSYVVAMHLVVRFTPHEILHMLAIVFSFGAVLSLVAAVAFSQGSGPALSISTGGGADAAWNGITAQRNALGRAAVLGFVCCCLNARVRGSRLVWPGFALIHVVLLLGSNSATSLGAFFGVCTLAVVLLGFRARKTLYGATFVAMSIIFGSLTSIAATDLGSVTGFLGRDTTFTGRVPLWQTAIQYGISEHPWLGYGWQGFWTNDDASFEVILHSGYDAPHAHNWFIDVWLMIGPIGSILSLALFLRALVWSTRYIRAYPTTIGLFPALIVSLAVVYSLTEAGFISRSIQFIMLIVASTHAATMKNSPRRRIVSTDVGGVTEREPVA